MIFDSGVGGLSIYKEIAAIVTGVRYIYVFDNAAFPYGELPANILIERCNYLISYFVRKYNAQLAVVACNTASTIVLPSLRKSLSIPVVGVVPAIKPAAKLSLNKKICLLATPATVQRSYTLDLINKYASSCEVFKIGTTKLVEMAESKMRGQKIDSIALKSILYPIVDRVDCLVLGCTHFPLLKQEIKSVLPDEIKLVDSGDAIARRVVELLGVEVKSKYEFLENLVFYSADISKDIALWDYFKGLNFTTQQLLVYPLLRS